MDEDNDYSIKFRILLRMGLFETRFMCMIPDLIMAGDNLLPPEYYCSLLFTEYN